MRLYVANNTLYGRTASKEYFLRFCEYQSVESRINKIIQLADSA